MSILIHILVANNPPFTRYHMQNDFGLGSMYSTSEKSHHPYIFSLFYRMVHSVMHNMPDIIYGNWKPISSPPKPIYPSQGNKSKIIIRI